MKQDTIKFYLPPDECTFSDITGYVHVIDEIVYLVAKAKKNAWIVLEHTRGVPLGKSFYKRTRQAVIDHLESIHAETGYYSKKEHRYWESYPGGQNGFANWVLYQIKEFPHINKKYTYITNTVQNA